MKLGSLFSGGGLGDFGFMAAGMDIAWQCEIDPYCNKILSLRYPESKKYLDIKTLKGAELEKVDIITGGFPCQPFSVAGKQKGKEDNRYLWPEMLRVIRECRPRWACCENVPGIINMALDTVCSDLEAEGYEVWPIVFPSHALGAPHKRDRLWIVAHSKCNGSHGSTVDRGFGETISEEQVWPDNPLDFEGTSILPATENVMAYTQRKQNNAERGDSKSGRNSLGRNSETLQQEIKKANSDSFDRCSEVMANSLSAGLEGQSRDGERGSEPRRIKEEQNGSISQSRLFNWGKYWESEPAVGRVANGIANRVDRLKCLGNGQNPACTYTIGRMIMDIERTLNVNPTN